jgi:DNA mismatch endonuclease (patch repair protein)
MADKINSSRRSLNMARIRAKDTLPEMKVRRFLHASGFRYRLHRKDLPGKPDIVFGPRKIAIFVHGCFWHQHSDPSCLDGRRPQSKLDYWGPKLDRNVERDAENQASLIAQGWQVLTIWECETKDMSRVEQTLVSFLQQSARRPKEGSAQGEG